MRLQPGERGAAVRLAFKQTRDTPARRLHACARWEGEGGQGSNYPLVASRHDALPRRSRRQANSVEWKQKRAGSGLLPCAVPSDQPLFSPPFFLRRRKSGNGVGLLLVAFVSVLYTKLTYVSKPRFSKKN